MTLDLISFSTSVSLSVLLMSSIGISVIKSKHLFTYILYNILNL